MLITENVLRKIIAEEYQKLMKESAEDKDWEAAFAKGVAQRDNDFDAKFPGLAKDPRASHYTDPKLEKIRRDIADKAWANPYWNFRAPQEIKYDMEWKYPGSVLVQEKNVAAATRITSRKMDLKKMAEKMSDEEFVEYLKKIPAAELKLAGPGQDVSSGFNPQNVIAGPKSRRVANAMASSRAEAEDAMNYKKGAGGEWSGA